MVAPDPARTGFATIRSTDAIPLEYLVRSSRVDLGRASKEDPPSKCALGDNQSISRQHARIEWDAATSAWVLTVQGKNGVVVNDDPVTTPDSPPRPLKSRDVLSIGNRRVVWHGPAPGWPVLTGDGEAVAFGEVKAEVKEEGG